MIYLAARCFFNSTFITLTRDGVEVDERPLKMCGPAQSLSFVDEEGLPVEFVVERNFKTRYGAPKIFYSVNQLDGNQQLMAALRLPLLLGGNTRLCTLCRKLDDTYRGGRSKLALSQKKT